MATAVRRSDGMKARLPPVRDVYGSLVRRVRVGVGEMTCTECGEVTTQKYCPRCNVEDEEEGTELFHWRRSGDGASESTLVPTVSYLAEDEFELAT